MFICYNVSFSKLCGDPNYNVLEYNNIGVRFLKGLIKFRVHSLAMLVSSKRKRLKCIQEKYHVKLLRIQASTDQGDTSKEPSPDVTLTLNF